MIFDFPSQPHRRRHGPTGYKTYQSFKDWLRDEFTFRCVFCLVRERWYPNGDHAFSVEHLIPQDLEPKKALDYDNLLYACLTCNSCKRAAWPIADPCQQSYSRHLRVNSSGHVDALTTEGHVLRHTLQLNEPRRVEFRNRMFLVYADIQRKLATVGAREEFRRWFGFPDNLPDLRNLRVRSNRRLSGLDKSYYVMQQAGKLPDNY
jgi:HNH endonuclease